MIQQKEKMIDDLFNSVYKFGYIDINRFKRDFEQMILKRIDLLYNEAQFVIIEKDYVEHEWKLLISKYYLHSAYADNLLEKAIRIHFLKEDKFSEDSYLGYITLRPLEELDISLSFIYMNWNHSFWDKPSYIMTYKKKVNYKGDSITIDTYPFMAQDTIVTCCADVNVIMMAKYMANKFNRNTENSIDVLTKRNRYNRSYPKRIKPELLEEMFEDLEIPFRKLVFNRVKGFKSSNWKETQHELDAYIESGLPVILEMSGHVIQIIGHLENGRELNKKYVVFDDSGYLEGIFFGKNAKDKHFCYLLSINDIKKYMNSLNARFHKDYFMLLMPEHKRVYISFENHLRFLVEYMKQQRNLDSSGKSLISQIVIGKQSQEYTNTDGMSIAKGVTFRSILVDNSIVKTYLKPLNIVVPSIESLLEKKLPHYLWYTEVSLNGKRLCYLSDPTMYHGTKDLIKMFLGLSPIGFPKGYRKLSLLTKSKRNN